MNPPARWIYVDRHGRWPISRYSHLQAWRAILAEALAAGQTAWIERHDGLIMYPRPLRRKRPRNR